MNNIFKFFIEEKILDYETFPIPKTLIDLQNSLDSDTKINLEELKIKLKSLIENDEINIDDVLEDQKISESDKIKSILAKLKTYFEETYLNKIKDLKQNEPELGSRITKIVINNETFKIDKLYQSINISLKDNQSINFNDILEKADDIPTYNYIEGIISVIDNAGDGEGSDEFVSTKIKLGDDFTNKKYLYNIIFIHMFQILINKYIENKFDKKIIEGIRKINDKTYSKFRIFYKFNWRW